MRLKPGCSEFRSVAGWSIECSCLESAPRSAIQMTLAGLSDRPLRTRGSQSTSISRTSSSRTRCQWLCDGYKRPGISSCPPAPADADQPATGGHRNWLSGFHDRLRTTIKVTSTTAHPAIRTATNSSGDICCSPTLAAMKDELHSRTNMNGANRANTCPVLTAG
jgi:hypothetical protein